MNEEIFITVFRTIFQSIVAIGVLFTLARLMGKKQISQLTFFDYVTSISIGSIAEEIATDDISEIHIPIISIIIFALFPIILSHISMKSYYARKLLDGVPTILVQNGKIIEKNIRKAKLTVNDLLELLRGKDAFNIADVEFAILETNGKLSVQLKASKVAVTLDDLNIITNFKGVSTNIIVDGDIITSNLDFLNKDKKWLNDELKKQNVASYKDVLLASIDNNNVIHIDRKNSDPIVKHIS